MTSYIINDFVKIENNLNITGSTKLNLLNITDTLTINGNEIISSSGKLNNNSIGSLDNNQYENINITGTATIETLSVTDTLVLDSGITMKYKFSYGDLSQYPSTDFSAGEKTETYDLGVADNQTGNTYPEQDGVYEISTGALGAPSATGIPSTAADDLIPNTDGAILQFPDYVGGADNGQYTGSLDESGTGYLGGWWKFQLPSPIYCTQYTIAKPSGAPSSGRNTASAREHRFYGSNDDSTWTLLNTVTGITNWGSNNYRSWTPSVTGTAYKYFLFVIGRVIQSNQFRVADSYITGYVQGGTTLQYPPQSMPTYNNNKIARLFTNLPEGKTYISASSTLNDLLSSAASMALINNVATSYYWASNNYYTSSTYNSNKDESGSGYLGEWLKIEYPSSFVIDNYNIRSANDVPNQAPKNFKLYGSNDDSNWTEIDERTNQTFTAGETKNYTVTENNSYNYYLLIINGINSGSAAAIGYMNINGKTNDGLGNRGSIDSNITTTGSITNTNYFLEKQTQSNITFPTTDYAYPFYSTVTETGDGITHTDSRYTISKPGLYRIDYQIYWGSDTVGQEKCMIQKNGTENFGSIQRNSSGFSFISGSEIIPFEKDDYFEIICAHNKGSNYNVSYVATYHTSRLTVYCLGQNY